MIEANRLAAAKRFSEALVRVEKVLETDPKNDEAYAAKGSLMYLMKDYEGAQGAWRKALELNPSNDMVRASLVDLNLNMDAPNRSPAGAEGQ
jgi:Flp pilus assembly protein TadD